MNLEKIIAIIGIIIVILNLILKAFNVISWQIFWITVIVFGFIAYIIIPWIKKIKK